MPQSTRWGWGVDDSGRKTPRPYDSGVGAASGTILDQIVETTRTDLEQTRRRIPLERLARTVETASSPRDFAAALRADAHRLPRIIAELKKASPSKGQIRRDFGVMTLSRQLQEAGAAALSVLTEPHYFKGSPRYLQAVASSATVPVLRKDFIVDEYQLYEARAWGADAVLLIAAALPAVEFERLHRCADRLGLAVLAEVHNRDELQMVLEAGAEVIGVNSRNLRTFEVDLATTEELIGEIPGYAVAVAESGIRTAADIRALAGVGAHAFLVGETLMAAASPGEALRTLLEEATE